MLEHAYNAATLAAAPATLMFLLSLLATAVKVPVLAAASLQHLAAGIVMSAIAVELVPPISEAPFDFATTMGMTIGFTVGISFFLLLRKFCDAEPEDDDDADEETSEGRPSEKRRSSTKYRAMGVGQSSFSHSGLYLMKKALTNPMEVAEVSGRGIAEALELSVPAREPYPFSLTAAVCVDALVDGFLIGLSEGSRSAGVVMASALAIEMGFLGLTFSSVLRKQPRWRSVPSIMLPPMLLILGGILGGLTTSLVNDSPPLKVGFLSFGVAALLYLVTEELLLEAHDNQDEDHIWWVDLMFFVGFFLSFLLEKFTSREE